MPYRTVCLYGGKTLNTVAMRSKPVGQLETNMLYSVTVVMIRMREDFQEKALVTSNDVTHTETSASVLERKSTR
jgi:hypothetical protein